MWWEVVPSLTLVVGFLGALPVVRTAWCWLNYNGKTTVRATDDNLYDFVYYVRDQNITGSWYKPRGLESIPDDD